jgi:hypothetical protein
VLMIISIFLFLRDRIFLFLRDRGSLEPRLRVTLLTDGFGSTAQFRQ